VSTIDIRPHGDPVNQQEIAKRLVIERRTNMRLAYVALYRERQYIKALAEKLSDNELSKLIESSDTNLLYIIDFLDKEKEAVGVSDLIFEKEKPLRDNMYSIVTRTADLLSNL
jgi:hypothetical protein